MSVEFVGFENDKNHRLGHRAFMMFFFRRTGLLVFLLALTAVVWYAQPFIPFEYGPYAFAAAEFISLLTVAYFLFLFFTTYLQYRYYTYVFTEEAFMTNSGYLLRTEAAALYHQIQNVSIVRSPLDRMIGVSRVVIYMTGEGRDSSRNQITLPGVGKKKAKLVQRELLVRARKHFNQESRNG